MDLKYVRFDVGHYLFVCHKSTLVKYTNSVLAKYVAPEFDTRKSGQDYIIIDRDGKHFGSILNFMRDENSLELNKWNDYDLTDIMREADFYCLTELVELCEKEFEARDRKKKQQMKPIESSEYRIAANSKLEIVLGLQVGREVLKSTWKQTIVISYQNVRKYNIDSWIEELVRLCDHERFNVYSFSDKSSIRILGDDIPGLTLRDFLVALYEPKTKSFAIWVSAPPYDKFRARRAHYKCKIFKFWFLVQNNSIHLLKKRTKDS